jgi:hypothetical protein
MVLSEHWCKNLENQKAASSLILSLCLEDDLQQLGNDVMVSQGSHFRLLMMTSSFLGKKDGHPCGQVKQKLHHSCDPEAKVTPMHLMMGAPICCPMRQCL